MTFRYTFRQTPFEHQLTALRKMRPDSPQRARRYYGLLMEQGTGKTKTGLDWLGMLFVTGQIDGAVVVAPNGVHDAWVLDQIPEHIAVPYSAFSWHSGLNKRDTKEFAEFCSDRDPETLCILTVNAEALAFESGREAIMSFMKSRKSVAVIIDEVDMFKNNRAIRTKWALRVLRRKAAFRMIMSGTIGSEKPFDLWAPFNFLEPTILGTSFATFRAEYAVMRGKFDPLILSMKQKGVRFIPDIVAVDENGFPRYRHLDRLQAKIKEHSFRVLKEDCLDLPPKLYVRRYVELTAAQRKVYNDAIRLMRIEWDDKMSLLTKLTLLLRLQQIVGGFYPDGGPIVPPSQNPKLDALLGDLEHQGNRQAIIWARFVPEIRMIADSLGDRCAAYYGPVAPAERTRIRAAFKAGDLQYIAGNPTVAGIGLDELKSATFAHYFSNDYSLRVRLQSEDRTHRSGMGDSITYFDYEARNTNDRKIINLLKGKRRTAELVTGDFKKEDWLNEI